MTEKVHLLLSDSNQIFRAGIRRILTSTQMIVAGEVPRLTEIVPMLRAGVPCDLLLFDPDESDEELAALHQIKQEFPAIKTVLLTNEMTGRRLRTAVEGGASAYLPKDISSDALRYSLEIVLLGEQIFPTAQSLLGPSASDAVANHLHSTNADEVSLSNREREILACLVDGQPNKIIARNLRIAEATVKVHLKVLLRKINARNRTQAAIWSLNHISSG